METGPHDIRGFPNVGAVVGLTHAYEDAVSVVGNLVHRSLDCRLPIWGLFSREIAASKYSFQGIRCPLHALT